MFLIGGIVSCSNKKTLDIDYNARELDEVSSQKLETVEIVTDYQFGHPVQIKVVNDTLIAVFDNNRYIVHLISERGRYLGGFGMIGKGNGEIVSPKCISVGSDASTVYLYDFKMARVVKFNVSDILKGFSNPVILENKQNLPVGVNRYTHVEYLDDDSYIGFGYNDNCRIQNVSNGHVADNYTEYPMLDENEEYTWSIWNNAANFAVSPDNKHIVITTGIGMLFEIFTVVDGKISTKALKAFHKPVFGIAKGAKPACVTYTDETFDGFTTICATNDGFYGCIGGKAPEYDLGNVIYYFDYAGDLEKKYKIDANVECLDIHKNKIYAIVTDDGGEYRLLTASL